MVIKVKNTGLFGKLYEYVDVHVIGLKFLIYILFENQDLS